jgi:chromosomal replication initiation ATPase DnaA
MWERFLGSERFIDEWRAQSKDGPSMRPRQSVARALSAVALGMGMDVAHLRGSDRSWAVSQQRTMAAYLLIRRWGYRAGQVAVALGRDPATLSSLLTRFANRLREEPALRRELERLTKIVKISKPDPITSD